MSFLFEERKKVPTSACGLFLITTAAQERLPIAEGWRPSPTTINFFRLNVLMAKLAWVKTRDLPGAGVEHGLKREL